MNEWSPGDVFYDTPEIGQGSPLNSTYSSISIANDAAYLYIGLQLQAPSSILSNWTHAVYIDGDLNPATGFNSGWMSGGYDYLVQYGGGGGVYSIYEFTGGGNQGAWSWNFLGTIQYGFDEKIIEWAIPRNVLNGSSEARILFQTSGGDVTVETWASASESGAKNYKFATAPKGTLKVISAHGTPTPAVGTYTNDYGVQIQASVVAPAPANGTQFVGVGWTMTGHEPSSGVGDAFSMTVSNNAVLTWLWATNVQVGFATNGPGTIAGSAPGYYAQGSTIMLAAMPEAGHIFKGWSGGVPPAQTNDNPLILTADKAQTVTANFGLFKGHFGTKTLDGSLSEWAVSEMFYDDPDILDGDPLGSTYFAIYVANDHQYLYVGMKLKAPSSINSSWTHELFLDTDLNPTTGYNSGWMANGYDRVVAYGANGTTYSVYEFTGASQGDWSWSFLTVINYAYDDDMIEWAIPRSALGGSTRAKLTFLTEGGSVSVQTWAHQAESLSRIYDFAPSPQYTVTVASARGTAVPAVGQHVYEIGTTLTNSVIAPAPVNGTQFVNVGWTMTGHDPLSGVDDEFSMTVTNNATLTWLWDTSVQLSVVTNGTGTVSGDPPGFYLHGSDVTLTATPDAGYLFKGWSGAVPPAKTNDNPLTVTMDQARAVTANFGPFTGHFGSKSLDGSLVEWDVSELFYDDPDIIDGAPLGSTYSGIYVANDHQYLYVGMKLKAPSSINSSWTHELFLDTDLNPTTGFNSGWMANGYDRMVAYGANGTTYSVYEFTGALQGDWSWNFLTIINYAYDDDMIEWAIPRSALGGSTRAKLTFLTEGGSVSVQTWAHHTESLSRIYDFAPSPQYTVTVASAHGTAIPAVGKHVYEIGTALTNSVIAPAPANGTQFVSVGWTMTDHAPASGVDDEFSMTATNNTTLTWLWETNVQLAVSVNGSGSTAGDGNDYYAQGAVVSVAAVPDAGYIFVGWSGSVPAGQTNDNPLSLTMDQRRNITANFAPHEGVYLNSLTVDGLLTDWAGVAPFYTDAEILDGMPLSSTFSAIYVANGLDNLYIGLQYKAPSSIHSNWIVDVYLDSDLNSTTGFDAGWMANGYDRLIRYGAGGSTYSVFHFNGAQQSDWSWEFDGLLDYAFDGATAELSIPLALLNLPGNQFKVEVHVAEGDVTQETWAHQSEADARVYKLGTPPPQSFEVISLYGSAQPAVGLHTNEYGTQINASVSAPAPANGTQLVVVGWTMTGNDPASGAASSFSMTHTNTATLTWLWNTNVNFTRTAGAHGTITGDGSGYYARGASVTVTAVPDGGYSFSGWSGDVPNGHEMDNPLSLTLDNTRSITANFSQNIGRYAAITLDGSLGEWTVQDEFYGDAEITDGLPLNSTYSSVSVANDNTYLYIGLKLKGASSINSNWLHELYIDSDMNPSTGFDSGWMSGGYDLLVQYGAGGASSSIFSFSGAHQADWGWAYVGALDYSFNNDVIEWAIPRALFGQSSIVRLEFHVSGGDVVTETWAHQSEADVKAYAFATENNCAAGIPPQIVSVADKTVDAGQLLTFQVRANDPGCIPPDITVIGKPGAASFTLAPSGTNQVGTFNWTPGLGDVGTYLVQFTAEDDEGATVSFVMRIYVAVPGEPRDQRGVPESQSKWAVQLTEIDAQQGGPATAYWQAVQGIHYDVYTSTGPFRDGMSWSRVVAGQEAHNSFEQTALSLGARTNFVQVVPAGASPTMNGVWGVIKPTVASGMSMLSAPLRSDLSFSGQFGAELADVLPQNTLVSIMHAGQTPTWTVLRLNGSKQWVLDSGAPQYTLAPGQAFFIENPGSAQTPAISGPVGNTGEQQLSLQTGFNLIGVSEGKILAASTAFEAASPIGNYDDELADQVVVLNPNGSWRRLIRRPTGTWYDTANPNGKGNTTLTLSPGQAYYYIRRSSGTTLDF